MMMIMKKMIMTTIMMRRRLIDNYYYQHSSLFCYRQHRHNRNVNYCIEYDHNCVTGDGVVLLMMTLMLVLNTSST